MAILTLTEAANVLRTAENDPAMLDLLPGVDAYIQQATGRDWAADNPVRPEAKSAARMLLVLWHENPGMVGQGITSLTYGLRAVLVQLKALALELKTAGVPAEALAIDALYPADGAANVAVTISPVVVFNHEMAADAINRVSLRDSTGLTLASTNTLDVTGRILTIDPAVDLAGGERYRVVIDAAADVYGATLTTEITFETA